MENRRNGWAFGLGIYSGAFQVFAGFILMLFCSKTGGTPYGVALIITGLICAAATFMAQRAAWARIVLLFLGVASTLLVFGFGFLIENLGGFTQGAESIVLVFRTTLFTPGILLFLSGIWCFDVPANKKGRFLASSIVYKVLILLGVAICAAVSALDIWRVMDNADFTEWLYGLFGDETLTGSALTEAQIMLRADFVRWVNEFSPLFEGIGILLVAMIPSYAWHLDSEGILFGGKSVLKSIIVTASCVPFVAVAEFALISSYMTTVSILSIIFAIAIPVLLGVAWFFYYAFPALIGKRPGIFYNEEYVYEEAQEAEVL